MPILFEQVTKKAPTSPPSQKDVLKRPQSPMSPLSAFAFKPEGVRFETQEPEETVELFLRQHPIVNIPWLVVAVIMLFAPTMVIPFVISVVRIPVTVPVQYIIVGTAFWYLATFGFVTANFLHWFFNIYIVTNERIVDIDFLYLLYKHFSIAELNKIQDLAYTEGGLLATMFDYGTVQVQTASEIPNIEFEGVPHPEKVVETIRSITESTGHNL